MENEFHKCVTKMKELQVVTMKNNVHYYKNWILSMLRKDNVDESAIVEACKRYKEKDLYDKPPSYFVAICKNCMKEANQKKQKEQKYLDSIPPIFES